MYSRMADKLSKESNSTTFKSASIYIVVTGMQGKATETQKNCNTDSKKQQQQNIKITYEKKKSNLIRQKCICRLRAF